MADRLLTAAAAGVAAVVLADTAAQGLAEALPGAATALQLVDNDLCLSASAGPEPRPSSADAGTVSLNSGPTVQWAIRLPAGMTLTACVRQSLERAGSVLRLVFRAEGCVRRLSHANGHDPVTGLPGISRFADHLDRAIAVAQRSHMVLGVMRIDLAGVRALAASTGADVAEAAMREAYRIAERVCRKGDLVGLGGEYELLVLSMHLRDMPPGHRLADRLNRALRDAFASMNQPPQAVHIGVSIYPRDGVESAALLTAASDAVHRARARSTDIEYADLQQTTAALHLLRLEQELDLAMERDEFHLVAQPQVSLSKVANDPVSLLDPGVDEEMPTVEVLLRWTHPLLGQVPPSQFIPVAESTGLIVPLGRWVIEQSLAFAAKAAAMGRPLCVAVNVSPQQLHDPAFVSNVAALLARYKLPGHHLELELIESTLADPATVVPVMQQLRSMGIRLAVDDFGTGYSCLAYLQDLPIDTLKIDRSFVSPLEPVDSTLSCSEQQRLRRRRRHAHAVVRSISQLCQSLKLRLVAEGVETSWQHRILTAHGCTAAQGFLFCRPTPFADLLALLAEPVNLRLAA